MLLKKLLLILLAGIPFLSQAQANPFDVVITEMMADPTPVVGLPNAEFVEIKNVSSTPVNLNGWKLSDATSTGTINSSFTLQPDSIAILCSTGNVATFSIYGRTIGVTSFPSLDNDGDFDEESSHCSTPFTWHGDVCLRPVQPGAKQYGG